ncbi:MAG TPA: hypothetical protein VMB75_01525, partial [Rhodocyclaceae bacterium]|nr:hypothetical protein [Rhodocyclaceae bacterium]
MINAGAAVILVLISVLLVSVAFTQRLYQQSRKHAEDSLESVAALKTATLQRWVEEATNRLAQPPSSLLANTLDRWLKGGGRPGADADLLQGRLDYLKAQSAEYQGLWLFDIDGRPWLRSAGTAEHPLARFPGTVDKALAERRPVLVDFHREAVGEGQEVVLEVLAPLLVASSGNGLRPVGFLLVQLAPKAYLYPMLSSWPTASDSAETFLYRVEDGDVVVLSPLRHDAAPPLAKRLPGGVPGLRAVQASAGKGPVLYGVDYRGVPSVGVAGRVPAMGWYLLAKIDDAEIFAEARRTAIQVAVAAALTLLSLAALATMLLRARTYREETAQLAAEVERLRAAEALEASEQRLSLALEAAKAGSWE